MGNSRQRAGKKLIVQGSILAIATIIVRLIGIVYRIPLTNIVGNEGMGYYGFAFEVYQFLVILSTNAVPVAVSKLTAARVARREYKNAQAIFRCSIIFAAVLSGTLALLTFVGARWISMVMFGGITEVAPPFGYWRRQCLSALLWGYSEIIPRALGIWRRQLFPRWLNSCSMPLSLWPRQRS